MSSTRISASHGNAAGRDIEINENFGLQVGGDAYIFLSSGHNAGADDRRRRSLDAQMSEAQAAELRSLCQRIDELSAKIDPLSSDKQHSRLSRLQNRLDVDNLNRRSVADFWVLKATLQEEKIGLLKAAHSLDVVHAVANQRSKEEQLLPRDVTEDELSRLRKIAKRWSLMNGIKYILKHLSIWWHALAAIGFVLLGMALLPKNTPDFPWSPEFLVACALVGAYLIRFLIELTRKTEAIPLRKQLFLDQHLAMRGAAFAREARAEFGDGLMLVAVSIRSELQRALSRYHGQPLEIRFLGLATKATVFVGALSLLALELGTVPRIFSLITWMCAGIMAGALAVALSSAGKQRQNRDLLLFLDWVIADEMKLARQNGASEAP